jgi:hypothetical protein
VIVDVALPVDHHCVLRRHLQSKAKRPRKWLYLLQLLLPRTKRNGFHEKSRPDEMLFLDV